MNYSALVGRRIRSLRKGKELTQEELGEKAGVNYKFIGALERGGENPTLAVLVKLSKALDVKPWELLNAEHEMDDKDWLEKEIVGRLRMVPADVLKGIFLYLSGVAR